MFVEQLEELFPLKLNKGNKITANNQYFITLFFIYINK